MRKKDYMETKQYATKKPNGSARKSKSKLKTTLRQMKTKTQPYKSMGWMQQKQFLEGSS